MLFVIQYNTFMKMKNVLILFIISFLCIIFCINHFSYKYIDRTVDAAFGAKNIIAAEGNAVSVSVPVSAHYSADKEYRLNEGEKLLVTLGASFLAIIAFLSAKFLYGYIFIALFVIFYFVLYKVLSMYGIYINLAAPVLSVLVVPVFIKTCRKVFTSDKSGRIKKILDKYISKDITDKIMKNPDSVSLGGKKAEITVMFADIRGFTTISETHSAEDVSGFLNEYFSEIEPVILKYNGVINKFIGDAVLVVFGDPAQDKDHVKKAVKCAYELKNTVKKIQERWICEGKPKIDIGIGINTGEAFVGNVGTQNRFEYTVIGDTVNIASRIEGYNRIYKTHVLISENTYNKISHIVDVIKIREVDIKGKSKKINIYEVLRITE